MNELAALCLHSDGSTSYEFAGPSLDGTSFDAASSSTRQPLPIRLHRFESPKGLGLVASTSIEIGTELVTNKVAAALPVGPLVNRPRVCQQCWLVSAKVKKRSDCANLTFCSIACITAAGHMIDTIGAILDSIPEMSQGDRDVLALTTAVLYRSAFGRRTEATDLLRVLALGRKEHTTSSSIATSAAGAEWLYNRLLRDTNLLATIEARCRVTIDQAAVEALLSIVQLNGQSLYLHGLPTSEPTLLTILPTLARVNHSCAPNASFRVYRGDSQRPPDGHKPLSGSECSLSIVLTAIEPISAGNEVTISYLTQLCLPLAERRALLHEAFGFHCLCPRCKNEEEGKQRGSEGEGSQPKTLRAFINGRINTRAPTSSQSQSGLLRYFKDVTELLDQLKVASDVLNAVLLRDEMAPEVYDVHATAMLILSTIKSVKDMDAYLQAMVTCRACFLISQCWRLCGCRYSLQRLEYLLAGVSSAAMGLGASQNSGYTNRDRNSAMLCAGWSMAPEAHLAQHVLHGSAAMEKNESLKKSNEMLRSFMDKYPKPAEAKA
jgi:SET domain